MTYTIFHPVIGKLLNETLNGVEQTTKGFSIPTTNKGKIELKVAVYSGKSWWFQKTPKNTWISLQELQKYNKAI